MASVPSVTLASILMRRAARSTVTGTEPAEGKFKVGAETLSSARASRRDGTAERDTSPRCKVEVTARDAARTLRSGANVFGGSGWTVAPTAISGAESCSRSSGTCGATAAIGAGGGGTWKRETTAWPAGTLPMASTIIAAKAQTSRDWMGRDHQDPAAAGGARGARRASGYNEAASASPEG